MTVATLRIQTEGGAEAVALVDRLERAVRGSRQRMVRETRAAAGQEAGAYRGAVVTIERAEQLLTRAKLRELAKQGDAQRKFLAQYTDAHKRATALIEAEVGKRGTLTDRERRQVESLALAMVSEHERAERRRTAATEAAEKQRAATRRRFFAGSGAAAGQALTQAAAAFADYGDDLRTRRRAREQVDFRAAQIASGDIGDAHAAPELAEATRRVALLSGLDPQGVIDAIGEAQANFSNLADATKRTRYLNNVLPQLAQAAVASNTSLTDMVNAAGEFQRQLGITNDQLPAAIAAAIQGGRLGSISFKDQAHHMGAIGGAAARFLSSREGDAMQSLATTNALFQFAGRAGGGGDMSATRAQAFLTNFTSGRGQNALRHTLGYNVMGADGQIVTRQGESQSAAFQRVIEEVYRRTGGNSTRFLDAMAGNNVRSRVLGDQLFRDLRTHGGRLTDFRDLVSQQQQGTVEGTITRPFESIARTGANARARREVREFYGLTGDSTRFAQDTERVQNDLREAHPFLGRALGDNPVFRGVLDATNLAGQQNLAEVSGNAARPQDREALLRSLAHDRAVRIARDRNRRNFGAAAPYLDVLFGGDDGDLVRSLEREQLQLLRARSRPRSAGGTAGSPAGRPTVTLAPESVEALARAIAANPPTLSQQTATHLETATAHRRSGD